MIKTVRTLITYIYEKTPFTLSNPIATMMICAAAIQ